MRKKNAENFRSFGIVKDRKSLIYTLRWKYSEKKNQSRTILRLEFEICFFFLFSLIIFDVKRGKILLLDCLRLRNENFAGELLVSRVERHWEATSKLRIFIERWRCQYFRLT